MYRPKVHNWFEDVCSRFPSNTAIEEPGKSVTYEKLKNRAGEIERAICAFNVENKEIVAVFMDASIAYVAAILAILKAGHIFMPVNLNFPERRILNILEKSEPRFFIIAEKSKDLLRQILKRLSSHTIEAEKLIQTDAPLDNLYLCWIRFNGQVNPADKQKQTDLKRQSDDACYVMTTSGSTGDPKIILGSHKGLSHFIQWETDEFDIAPDVRCTFLSHVTFDVSLRDIFAPLLSGGTICIPDEAARKTPGKLINWIEGERISFVHIVPTLLRTMFSVLPKQTHRKERFRHLKYALIAGEPLYGNDVLDWRDRINNTTRLINIYGPSETTLAKLFYEIKNEMVQRNEMLPIGKPIPDTQVLIVNNENRLCEIGEIGEIYIKTPYRSLGYLNYREQESQSFVPNPIEEGPAELVYKTGDLGKYLDRNMVMCIGRRDNQVKLFGNRVEINEIEVVLRMHPKVQQAAVGVKKDPFRNDRLIGYIVPDKFSAPTTESLRRLANEYLPDYMIPSLFVMLDDLPLTHNNKIDRKSLPEPTKKRPILEQEFIRPGSETEKQLVNLWAKALDLETVGIDDNFFDVGGTSILSMHLIGVIKAELGLDLSVTKIFQYPTVRKLAQFIGEKTSIREDNNQAQSRAHKRRAAIERRRIKKAAL